MFCKFFGIFWISSSKGMGKCPGSYENWTFCNMGHPRPLSTHILKSGWFYMFYTSEMFSHSHSLFEKWVVLHVYTSEMYCHSNSLFKKVGGFTCFPCVTVRATQFCTQSGWFYIKSFKLGWEEKFNLNSKTVIWTIFIS